MMLVRSRAAAAALAASLALLSASALAQGTARQRAACAGDAIRFCARDIPNVRRITVCMIRHFDYLSRRCQAVFYDPYGSRTRYRGRYYD
jgi:hypothetical protein